VGRWRAPLKGSERGRKGVAGGRGVESELKF